MHAQRSVRIAHHDVGAAFRPFVVAEVSGNHNGDLGRALAIVDAIAESGAQAVKFQTYTADTITIDVDAPAFHVSDSHGLWGGQTLYSLYERAHTPWEWHPRLFERAREHGLVPFSSPFDATAVDLLEDLDAAVYKIASLEIGDLALLRRVARTGKPVILSTGAAELAEVDLAVRTVRAEGNDDVVVLACTSSYPALPSESNLRSIPVLGAALDTVIGLSDHSPGIGAAVAAVALGATLIEKHVTLARSDGGVDADFSLEPAELAALATETDRAWQALGDVVLRPTAGEAESLRLRRSLYVVADAPAGTVVTEEHVRSIRPAGGLAPAELENVLGRTFARDVRRGTPLTWDLL